MLVKYGPYLTIIIIKKGISHDIPFCASSYKELDRIIDSHYFKRTIDLVSDVNVDPVAR